MSLYASVVLNYRVH